MEGAGEGVETFLRPVADLSAVRECYDKHGVVGVTGVLSKDECDATLEYFGLLTGIYARDAATYNDNRRMLNRFGVIGTAPLFAYQLLQNRVHRNVIAAYSAVYGLPPSKLVVQHDRAAIMRPTVGHPEWDTPYSYPGLHLDVEPQCWSGGPDAREAVDAYLASLTYADTADFISENNAKHWTMGRQVQGVLNLIDNRLEDGGFQCVPMADPGAWLKAWATSGEEVFTLPREPNGKYIFDARSFERLGLPKVRVPCPAGTLILFDACLPHGTEPNRSLRPRAIQFIRYMPKEVVKNPGARTRAVRREWRLASGFDVPASSDAAKVLFC